MEKFFKPDPKRQITVRFWCVSCSNLKLSTEYYDCDFNPNGKSLFCKNCEDAKQSGHRKT